MTSRTRRKLQPLAAAVGASTLAALVGFTGGAHAAPVAPTYFPASVGLNSSAYTLQFSGANREGTAAGIALDAAQSGSNNDGYPFQAATPDANPTTPATLYGPKACPTTLVLAADDTPADALSAAGLYGVAALAVTDTAGKSTTFDTHSAALLLTQSGRDGATQLDTTTNAAIAKIKAACASSTINGLVLGGTLAIPDSVVSELKSLVKDVARIAGTTREDTARAVAVAVVSSNGTGLRTVHYFPAPSAPGAPSAGGTALPSTVFLAEDQTGADALAVGAVAARLGVPILLTASTSLPQATANALGTLAPKNIVVLGGTSAISDAVVSSAQTAAGTGVSATRIAGANRYATSVAIAEQLFNLYPDYATTLGAAAYSDQLFGLARDEGSAAAGNHTGWPAALASAYYLASLAGGSTAPARVVQEVANGRTNDGEGTATPTVLSPVVCGASGSKCFAYTPLLLTTGGTLAPEIAAYLSGLYPTTGSYKTGQAPAGNNDGGFAFIFGGTASVTTATSAAAANGLAGGAYPAAAFNDDGSPALATGTVFYTTQDLTNFTNATSGSGTSSTFVGSAAASTSAKVCVLPGGSTGLAATEGVDELGGYATTNPVDYYAKTVSAYPAGVSLGSCIDLTTPSPVSKNSTVNFYGVSLSGNTSTPVAIDYSAAKTFSATSLGTLSASTSTGDIFGVRPGVGPETETLEYSSLSMNAVTVKGTATNGATGDLKLSLTRAAGLHSQDVITWTGELKVTSGSSTLFDAHITNGEVDATPASSGSSATISSPINLFGLSSTPGLGAITLTLVPPTVPMSTAGVAQVGISGIA